VLPFKNLTGDPQADFLQFALADGIITELAQLRSLIVRPSAYVLPYVGLAPDPRQVADELAASLVLTGSFLRVDGQLRLTVQVLSAETGEIVWSDRLDTASGDALRIQDALSDRLIAGLRVRFMTEEERAAGPPPTRSPEAYDFGLRGRELLLRYVQRTLDDNDLERAIRLFHEAIGLDEGFALAHAWLGRCYVLYAQGYGGGEYYILAERALRRALELDPSIVDARLQLVYVHLHHGDKQRARELIEQLRGEQPRDPAVLFVAALLDRLDGLFERALALYDEVLALSPRDVAVVSFNKARIFSFQGRYDEALAELEKGRAVEPDHPLLKTFKAVALFNLGRLDEAQALIEDVLRAHPHFDGAQPLLGWCLSARGRHEDARALIGERVKAVAAADQDVAFWLASLYAMEGLVEPALEWARTSVRLGNENYPLFEHSSKLRALRDDPRFVELMAELRSNWEKRRQ
jgi:tetratricopeptide (TPR) repeat protein